MMMLVYGIDEDAAFNLLKWLSQEANVKLRPLAEQISEDFRGAGPALTTIGVRPPTADRAPARPPLQRPTVAREA